MVLLSLVVWVKDSLSALLSNCLTPLTDGKGANLSGCNQFQWSLGAANTNGVWVQPIPLWKDVSYSLQAGLSA